MVLSLRFDVFCLPVPDPEHVTQICETHQWQAVMLSEAKHPSSLSAETTAEALRCAQSL
jgi:hypothetical protein